MIGRELSARSELYQGSSQAQVLRLQTYLRLAEADVQLQECDAAGGCPTGDLAAPLAVSSHTHTHTHTHTCCAGTLPALDTGEELIGPPGSQPGPSARLCLAHLQTRPGALEEALSPSERATCRAFAALIQLHLEPASTYALWCEDESFRQHSWVICSPLCALLTRKPAALLRAVLLLSPA